MRDRVLSSQSARLSTAISDVDDWIRTLPGGVQPLTDAELKNYSDRRPVAGWRMRVEFSHGQRELDLLVDDEFPRKVPRVALVNPPPFLSVPHIERDGVLCLLPDAAESDPFEPVNVVRYVLHAAGGLLDEVLVGGRFDDFRAEFHSYWLWDCSPKCPPIFSLVDPRGPTRTLRLFRGRERVVIAETDEELCRWLSNLLQDPNPIARETETALLLWLERPLIPAEYPRTGAALRQLAEAAGGAELLQELVAQLPDQLTVVLGATTANGPCFGGVLVSHPGIDNAAEARRHRLTDGFRPDKVPKTLLASRFITAAAVERTTVERVDAQWVHGRGQDPRFESLRNATVAVLGCGSVGGAVAVALATAGVGRLILIDPQDLSWANVGRHPLGALCVHKSKAIKLANRLRADFPHIVQATGWNTTWQQAAKDHGEELAACNLIVSAIGDWAAEGALNEWHLERERRMPIVYGWSEPHAVAGHALAILAAGGCLQCNVDTTGLPTLRVTEWPVATMKQEPGCGAVYQPYGPVELGAVVNLVAELAIDCLLGAVEISTHRIWAARQNLVTAAGGKWTPEWTSIAGSRTYGAFVEERPWKTATKCPECSATVNHLVLPSAAPANLSSSQETS